MNYQKAQEKAKNIVSQMTVEEKLTQLLYNSPAIERLGINEYNWWNEASHGIARAGVATVFPHAITLASTFNPELIGTVANAISDEARGKYNKSVKFGDRDIYKGLTYWAPNINIFRDPRWGRGQETFGEDPFLTAKLATKFIGGIQGDGEFLKAAACAKHFAVHSGPENLRHTFDAISSKKDLFETYLPAFEYAVKKAEVAGIMGAYNRTNGQPCCAHTELMEDILRKDWGFKGYYVSDCGAINDIHANHKYVETAAEGAAVALKRGCDLNCGEAYKHLTDAYEEDLITEEDIDTAVINLYTIRALLGEFEENRPFSDVPYSKVDCAEHKALNLSAAREGLVLLENKDNYLPVNSDEIKTIAVVGPNAISTIVLEGNYQGRASEHITVADGVRRVFNNSNVLVAEGCHMLNEVKSSWNGFEYLYSEGMAAAEEADLTVLCLGFNRAFEGEENSIYNNYISGGDRKTMLLPETQTKLANYILDVCDNVVIVVMSGCPVDLGEEIKNRAKAVVQAWFPGAVGGMAVAELIAGKFSPSGRLPITFPKAETALPEFTNYDMQGRTYRYLTEEPLYPFGYGLSYSEFEYSDFKLINEGDETITVSVNITNKGKITATEKVQAYSKIKDSRTTTPNYQLCGVTAVTLDSGETKTAELEIDRYWLKAVLSDGSRVDPDSSSTLFIGGHQPDELSCKLCGNNCLKIEL